MSSSSFREEESRLREKLLQNKVIQSAASRSPAGSWQEFIHPHRKKLASFFRCRGDFVDAAGIRVTPAVVLLRKLV